MAQAVLCLHLAAVKANTSVDTAAMAKLAGLKTKTAYTSAYNTAESVLGLEVTLSVQVQLVHCIRLRCCSVK